MEAEKRVESAYSPVSPDALVFEKRPGEREPPRLVVHQLDTGVALPVQSALAGAAAAGVLAVERPEVRVRLPLAVQERQDHLQ